MLKKMMPRPAVTRSKSPYTFHPDMLDETKTTLRLAGDVQEGVGALAPSDFGVDFTLTIRGTVRPDTLYARQADAVSKTVVRQITPLKILLNELEQGHELLKPIPVAIQEMDGSFVASFTAANVNASGESWDEAVLNLMSLIIDKFDMLLAHRPNTLGPAPRKQLSVLQSYIRR